MANATRYSARNASGPEITGSADARLNTKYTTPSRAGTVGGIVSRQLAGRQPNTDRRRHLVKG
jgi:hypothetical protein